MQVRDLLTTEHEQQLKKSKQPGPASSLSKDAIMVDAVVSTIGFPLVGGPAGTMEGGRQADVAKAILTAKNVPYVVAAPLLIQVSATNSLKPTPGVLVVGQDCYVSRLTPMTCTPGAKAAPKGCVMACTASYHLNMSSCFGKDVWTSVLTCRI